MSLSLSNNVKKSQKSVPAVNKYGQYNLETFDGMCAYMYRRY